MSASQSPAAVKMTAEQLQAPDRSKDIRVGMAVVPYGWDNWGNQGWRLPGRRVTSDYMTALRACEIMARIMERGRG